MQKRWKKLLISLLICFGVSWVGGFFTQSGVDSWYTTLERPPLTPPNWVFGPVWTLLYAMMAVALWLLWETPSPNKGSAFFVFALQLALNGLWSFLFFHLQSPFWALLEIVILWLAITTTVALFYRHSKLAALLLIPYLLWVTFAIYLNLTFWILNH